MTASLGLAGLGCGDRPGDVLIESRSAARDAPDVHEPRAGRSLAVVHDFGNVDVAGGPVALTFSFELRNDGGGPLQVATIKPDCGCVKASIQRGTILPGDSTELAATLDVVNPGRRTSSVTVVFDDGSAREFVLTARGTAGVELIAARDVAHLVRQSGMRFVST
jgi:hypothetical protein